MYCLVVSYLRNVTVPVTFPTPQNMAQSETSVKLIMSRQSINALNQNHAPGIFNSKDKIQCTYSPNPNITNTIPKTPNNKQLPILSASIIRVMTIPFRSSLRGEALSYHAYKGRQTPKLRASKSRETQIPVKDHTYLDQWVLALIG